MPPRLVTRLLLAVAALAGLVALTAPARAADPAHPVTLSAALQPASLRPGEYGRLVVRAAVAPGWHLYSLTPTPPPGPTPTTITLAAGSPLVAAGPATETTPTTKLDPNFGKPVAYHLSAAAFYLPVRLAAASNGKASSPDASRVVVAYQTCNDRICLPPTSATLTLPASSLAAGPARPAYAHSLPPIGVAGGGAAALPTATAPLAVSAGGQPPAGWLGFAAAAFGAGLLALLTPCVFPLIPVTFGFFTKQVSGDRRKLIGLAGAYAVGIIVSFTVLGLAAALLFGAAGANRVAANPWFNLFFGGLFVVFAFSFFEAIIIQLPPALGRITQPAAGASGWVGVLLMGLAFVFAAFTCTAPFIGTVLVAAAAATGAAQWARPLVGMVCFAVALALPFFLLALFPALLQRLPRSGGWLTRFKGALGFVELAYALTYFSKADLVWQAHILTRPVIFALWALIAALAALYLLGLLRVSAFPEEGGRVSGGRWLSGGAFLAMAIYCMYALTGRPVNALVLAYLPPSGYGAGSDASGLAGGKGGAAGDPDAGWIPDYQVGLAQARATGKPVFLDFTGYTCTNCRYVEQNIFAHAPVSGLLATRFTLVRLYTDGGPHGAANQALQQSKFGTVALPLYAVVSPAGAVVAQLSGSGETESQFAAFLTRSGQMASAAPPDPAPAAAWSAYSPAAAASAQAASRPAIIDFTASWCTNCHAIERTVFPAPSVAGQLSRFTTLRADLTSFYSAPSAALEKRYGVTALPCIVFLGKDGKEVPGTRVTGLVPAAEFARRMALAG